jgi:hypothetical protein
MKYNQRAKIYKGSNVTFNPETVRAYSYDWWVFVAKIEGKVIFNNYQYSKTTRRHQTKVMCLIRELYIKIDAVVEVPNSLGEFNDLESLYLASEEYLCDKYLQKIMYRQEYYERAKQRKIEANEARARMIAREEIKPVLTLVSNA